MFKAYIYTLPMNREYCLQIIWQLRVIYNYSICIKNKLYAQFDLPPKMYSRYILVMHVVQA